MSMKFLVLGGGGILGLGLGGGGCRFYFYGRGDFSEFLLRMYILNSKTIKLCALSPALNLSEKFLRFSLPRPGH